jgi:hypothetical protein
VLTPLFQNSLPSFCFSHIQFAPSDLRENPN